MNVSYIKNYAVIGIAIIIYLFNPNVAYSDPSYPNFTEVVEKNIPAVVIVHAKKTISNSPSMNPNIPNLPDEFKPFLINFLMKIKMLLEVQEKLRALGQIYFNK